MEASASDKKVTLSCSPNSSSGLFWAKDGTKLTDSAEKKTYTVDLGTASNIGWYSLGYTVDGKDYISEQEFYLGIKEGERNLSLACSASMFTVKADGDATPTLTENVLAVPKEKTGWGAWCPSPQAYFRGETYMEGATYHVGFQIFAGANDTEDTHFHQGAEEYIFFMGADPMNFFDFDAEIEMTFGDDPDHMESKIITKPTVVRIPANTWHCPIRFRKMKKPVMFQAAFMSGTWGTIVSRIIWKSSCRRTLI